MNIEEEQCDVLIIGAGAAGIGAARKLLGADEDVKESLQSKNLKVVILEARTRIGGRAWTSDELQSGIELDHGGKWIHGSTSKENVMSQLASWYDVPTSMNELDSSCSALTRKKDRKGNITRVILESKSDEQCKRKSAVPSAEAQAAAMELYKLLCDIHHKKSLIAPMKELLPMDATYKDAIFALAKIDLPDEPFKKWLELMAQRVLNNTNATLVQETIALLRHQIYWNLECYEGGRLDVWSLRNGMTTDILPGPNAEVLGGYGNLVKKLAECAPIDIRLEHRVVLVERLNANDQSKVVVTVECTDRDESKYQRRFIACIGCIITLPLGVLQQSTTLAPIFVPPLPDELMGAIDRLALCLMNKIEISFPHRWWPEGTGELNFASVMRSGDLCALGNMPWSWWMVEEDEPAILVCYATGVFAERIETMSEEDIQTEAIDTLRVALLEDSPLLGISNIPDPVRVNVTKWRSDPFARGSWTYFKAGSMGMSDVSTFQIFNQVQGGAEKLYFAGEHTCDGCVAGLDIGTVHGAYLSGRLAADNLLEDVQNMGDWHDFVHK
jgi:monoamine oxidase